MGMKIFTTLTHLAYTVNAKKRDITVFKAQGKCALGDIIYCCQMTPVMALDGVTSFLCLKDVTNTFKCMRHSPTISGNGEKLEEAECFKCVSCRLLCVRIEKNQL